MKKTQTKPKEYKTIPFKGFKFEEDLGIVEHLVSIFGIEDLGGDVVHPGAFTKTIQERGERIRVLDSHRRGSCLDVLGKVLSLKEIPRDKLPPEILSDYPEATGGLWARTQFLLDTPEGKGVFSRIKSGAVDEFSFGYDTLDEDFSDDDKGHEVRNLRTLRLWEYSPVIFGMNQATTVTGVKAEDEEVAPVIKVAEEVLDVTKCSKCGALLVAKGVDDPVQQQGSGAMDLITIEQAQIEIELASTGAGPATW